MPGVSSSTARRVYTRMRGVDDISSDGADLTLYTTAGTPNPITIIGTVNHDGVLRIDWGDGSATLIRGDNNNVAVSHTYEEPRENRRIRITVQSKDKLTWLNLAGQKVVGSLRDLQKFVALERLYLNDNPLFSGDIEDLRALPRLEVLKIPRTLIQGDISSLSSLTKLQELWLNNLPGIHGELCGLYGLADLRDLRVQGTAVRNAADCDILPQWDFCDINISHLNLPEDEVDNFLRRLNESSTESTKLLTVLEGNAEPSSFAGAAHMYSLQKKGWRVI